MEVVDGDSCGAVSGTVCEVRNDLLSGVFLAALEEVRCGCGGQHSVFQNGVAYLNRAEKSFVFKRHTFLSFPDNACGGQESRPPQGLNLVEFAAAAAIKLNGG
jgi:hypothetical protein